MEKKNGFFFFSILYSLFLLNLIFNFRSLFLYLFPFGGFSSGRALGTHRGARRGIVPLPQVSYLFRASSASSKKSTSSTCVCVCVCVYTISFVCKRKRYDIEIFALGVRFGKDFAAFVQSWCSGAAFVVFFCPFYFCFFSSTLRCFLVFFALVVGFSEQGGQRHGRCGRSKTERFDDDDDAGAAEEWQRQDDEHAEEEKKENEKTQAQKAASQE